MRRLPAFLLLGVFALAQTGYLLAVPAFRGPDEFDHAYRASSVAEGHWWAGQEVPADGGGYLLKVDQSLPEAAFEACDALTYPGPDNCIPVSSPDENGLVEIASTAATYNPFWYALTGTVAAQFSGDNFLFALRATNLLFVGAILLLALAQASMSAHPVWPVAGIAVAFTPILGFSTTVAAPNGVTYAAGILLWSSILRIASAATPTRSSWIGVGLGASLVMLTHTTGLLFVPLIAVCTVPLLWHRRSRLVNEWRLQSLLVVVSVLVIAVLCATWVLAAGTNDPDDSGDSFGSIPLDVVWRGPFLWFLQSIATLAFRNEVAPVPVYAIGAVVVVVLIILSVRHSQRSQLVSLGLIVLGTLCVPLALTILTYDALGVAWQGRYALPLSVGVVLVSTHALSTATGLRDQWVLPTILISAMVVTHALTLVALVESFRTPISPLQVSLATTLSLLVAALVAWALRTLASQSRQSPAAAQLIGHREGP